MQINFLTTDATDLRKKVFGSRTNREQYLAFLNIFWIMNDTQVRLVSNNKVFTWAFKILLLRSVHTIHFLDPTIITALFHFQFIEVLTRITSFFESG